MPWSGSGKSIECSWLAVFQQSCSCLCDTCCLRADPKVDAAFVALAAVVYGGAAPTAHVGAGYLGKACIERHT